MFWIGEGVRFPWLGEDLALIGLIAEFLVISALAIVGAKRTAGAGRKTAAMASP